MMYFKTNILYILFVRTTIIWILLFYRFANLENYARLFCD